MKWLVDQQISGDPALNYDPAKGPVRSPWLSWGAYTWGDGLVPRSDGLIWECKDFNNDGTHPNTTGRAKVANMLMDFFRNDSTSREWFYAGPPPPPPPPANAAPKVESSAPASWPARMPIGVKATVTDNDTAKVEVAYRDISGAAATVLLVRDSGGATPSNWSGAIPAQKWPGAITYSITATDSKPQTGRWPASGEARVQIVDPAPPVVSHGQKVSEAVRATSLTFEATVTDEVGIDSIKLLTWAPGTGAPTVWKMTIASGTNESGAWTATIALPDAEGTFRYAFSAKDSAHETLSPSSGEYEIKLMPKGGPGPAGPGGSGVDPVMLSLVGAVIVAGVVAALMGYMAWKRKKRSRETPADPLG